jgi:hypothetical protein
MKCIKDGLKKNNRITVLRGENMKEGSNAERTRKDLCVCLQHLYKQLNEIAETIEDIGRTLQNEEYDEE